MTAAQADKVYAAKWDIDSARGHLDTAACLIDSATEYLDGNAKGRAIEILDSVNAVLAALDRLRAAL